MSVYVGLDCGGSSSRVLAVDEAGAILFQGQSGAANLVSTPENRLRKNLTHATNGCPPARYVCGCFAGLISDEVRTRGEAHLRELFPGAEVRAEPDYTAAFYASPAETDICVIAGTGSLVCSRIDGRIVKSGGRGFILGDAGSAYQYGRDALMYYLDNPRTASQTLRHAVGEVFQTEQESEIVAMIYKAQTPAGIIAKLAKALGADARNGDAYALESAERNCRALAAVVARHVRTNMPETERLNVSLTGGVWKASPVFRDTFTRKVEEATSGIEVIVHRITRPPLYGAVELAKEMKIGN